MATKICDSTRGVAAVVYAPSGDRPTDLESAAERFADLLKSECSAAETGWSLP